MVVSHVLQNTAKNGMIVYKITTTDLSKMGHHVTKATEETYTSRHSYHISHFPV